MSDANEILNKSIDSLIDELFTEDVEKSIEIAGDASETADEAAGKAPKGQKDEARGAGRPKQISDVPQTDTDGRRASDFDSSTTEKGKEKDIEEANQVKEMNQIKAKGGNDAKAPKQAPFKKSLDEDEVAELEAFRKAKADAEVESLKKAEETKQEELIKSVVERTAAKVGSEYKGEIETLKKSLEESNKMIKAMASAPRTAKSITGIEQLEKSTEVTNNAPTAFSKSEMADMALEAFQKGVITEEQCIEMDNAGYIYDQSARQALENFIESKNK